MKRKGKLVVYFFFFFSSDTIMIERASLVEYSPGKMPTIYLFASRERLREREREKERR